jgi:hypothetical protein
MSHLQEILASPNAVEHGFARALLEPFADDADPIASATAVLRAMLPLVARPQKPLYVSASHVGLVSDGGFLREAGARLINTPIAQADRLVREGVATYKRPSARAA